MEFGEVAVGGRSGILPLTLSNGGRGRLRLREIRVGGRQPGEFQIVPGTCEGIPFLAPGGRCGIGLRFRPIGAGARSATLTIRHDAPGGELTVEAQRLGSGQRRSLSSGRKLGPGASATADSGGCGGRCPSGRRGRGGSSRAV